LDLAGILWDGRQILFPALISLAFAKKTVFSVFFVKNLLLYQK